MSYFFWYSMYKPDSIEYKVVTIKLQTVVQDNLQTYINNNGRSYTISTRRASVLCKVAASEQFKIESKTNLSTKILTMLNVVLNDLNLKRISGTCARSP